MLHRDKNIYLTRLLSGVAFSVLTLLNTNTHGLAQERHPYPSSSAIEAMPIPAEQRARLENLITAPRDPKLRKRITDQLCAPVVKRAEVVSDAVKPVLSVVENSGVTDILFSLPSTEGQTGPTQFSYTVEFFANQVLLRHGTPRFTSEAAGVIVPFPADYTRGVWTEGKLGTDILVLVPTTKDCGVQAVVLCPRVYKHPDKLVRSGFAPAAARWFYTAKADGLAASTLGTPQAPEPGRVMASILGNANVSLPALWSAIGNDPRNPAATTKHTTRAVDLKNLPPFISATLPHIITLQSRLDFGTQVSVVRTATRSTTVEITEFPVRGLDSIQVKHSRFSVEDGMCYLIAQSIVTTL